MLPPFEGISGIEAMFRISGNARAVLRADHAIGKGSQTVGFLMNEAEKKGGE